MKKIKVYLASGWFTESTLDILHNLESILSKREDIELYSPSRDGVKLPPNQKHDTALRESIFEDNISHIKKSDLVVANVYSGDFYNDPGTMYEIGYAMANNVPVVGYTPDFKNIAERFKGVIQGFDVISDSPDSLDTYLNAFRELKREKPTRIPKVLFVGNGDSEVEEKIMSYIVDSGARVRWLNGLHTDVYTRIDEIFEDVDYMLAVIDDRNTLVSWMIGQAYARGVKVITYSDHNYGINVMLLVSVLTHLRGIEELSAFLHQVKRYGLESIPKLDISQLESM